YLAFLKQNAPEDGHYSIDGDTLMDPHTLSAAWAAAGAGISAVDDVMQGKADTDFCAVWPPGNHARPNKAQGFCFFNNIAVATAYALETYGLKRVAIIDFDVHHGNGTEEIFEHDERVLMCSFYQHPLFPVQVRECQSNNMVN